MNAPPQARLARECEVFCRYLVGRPPDAYVQEKYALAHRVAQDYSGGTKFDALLLGLARSGPAGTRLADSYACLLARGSLLRKKLVLLVAILEACSAARGFEDSASGAPPSAVFLQMAVRGAFFGLRLLLVAVPLLLLQLFLGGAPAGREP
jgi:hypothetical protein